MEQVHICDETNPVAVYTVYTEEYPNIDEIRCMLGVIGFVQTQDSSMTGPDTPITPCIIDHKFSGKWMARVMGATIHIILFKGTTSCVDYMLFAGAPDPCATGSAEHALCILESTKTSDKESRNTAVNQRIIKFTTYFRLYPRSTAIPVMFWLDANWTLTKLTPTAVFGFKLMTTIGIRLFMNSKDDVVNSITDMGTVMEIGPFISVDDMIQCKNNIPEKKGNVSVKLAHRRLLNVKTRVLTHVFDVSIKLDKGKNAFAGKISHDPNVGLLSGLLNAVDKLEPNSRNIITNHNVLQEYFDKCPKSKLWYSIHGLHIEFDGITVNPVPPPLPSQYFVVEHSMTEKLATILCQMTSSCATIFSNHGGCALTSVLSENGQSVSVGRTMNRPDILFADPVKKEITIVEGKVESDIRKGVVQLGSAHLSEFVDMVQSEYPEYTIRRGLCVTIDCIKNISKYDDLQFPVLFALDASGAYLDRR
jgi:hypothetical protein